MRGKRAVVRIAVAGIACVACGCAQYVNYPAIGDDAAINDTNIRPTPQVITMAVSQVVALYPPGDEYVVNYPQGTALEEARKMTASIGPGARRVEPGTEGLPVLHVTRVWLRGDRATVEVLRPVTALPAGPDGQAPLQPVTVRLRKRPFSPWEVSSVRAWSVGSRQAPELYGWAEDFAPDEGEAPDAGAGEG